MVTPSPVYRGRLAPSPTGLLHVGHARTFWTAQQRAQAAGGVLLLRNDDLDRARCRPEFVAAMVEDMSWFGLAWTGPMVSQSTRLSLYRAALARLHAAGFIYPCHRSRRDVLAAASAPHEGDENDEPLYPPEFRPAAGTPLPPLTDPVTSYQLACVVDDAALGITEVVRGADLLKSTFRQLLLYRALGLTAPAFCHCPLVADDHGVRLAKRHDALALRTLRLSGQTPAEIRAAW